MSLYSHEELVRRIGELGRENTALRAELAAIKAGGRERDGTVRHTENNGVSTTDVIWVKHPRPEPGTAVYLHPHVTLTEEQVRTDFDKWAATNGTDQYRVTCDRLRLDTVEFMQMVWLSCAKHYGRVGGGA